MFKQIPTIIILIFLISFFIPKPIFAQSASLYLSPQSGTFSIGSTFNISAQLNTGGNDVNALEVNLKFDPKMIQVVSPTVGKSFVSIWITQPKFSNTGGTIDFQGGVPSPGINTSSGLVSTITFRAITPGKTQIEVLKNSKVLLNDGLGTNILTSIGRGFYDIIIPPPEGPEVFSPTHPDQNKWYRDNNVTFKWEAQIGVTGFSYKFNQDFSSVPDTVSEGNFTSISYSNVKSGIWYFHLRAEKSGVWGGVSTFLVRIDNIPPAEFPIEIEARSRPIAHFVTTDSLSGISHYEIKFVNLTKNVEGDESNLFIEASSPYMGPDLEIGKYLAVVRAYDNAGNLRDSESEFKVTPEGILPVLFFITENGVVLFGIFIPWWLVILILAILVVGFIISIILWLRHHRKIYHEHKNYQEQMLAIHNKAREDESKIREHLEKVKNKES